jgi:hypothetical protein
MLIQFARTGSFIAKDSALKELSSSEHLRVINGTAGRVYQLRRGHSRVAIDWNPVEPVAGHGALTRGEAVFHPTEGKVVYFTVARRRRGTIRLAVRTGARLDLNELFDLATELKQDLLSEISATAPQRRREALPSSPEIKRKDRLASS